MQSTGVYWKPVYYVLEGEFTILLVNPASIKNMGPKTDARDARWIAQLLECDLLRGSFIPPEPIRVLRSLTRYRKKITEQRVQEIQRLQDVLEDAGIKLSSVASNILGVSGRAMIEALAQGRQDPEALAGLARGSLRGKKQELRKALEGHFAATHAFLVEEILGHLDHLEAMLERLNDKINESLQPYQKEVALLQSIPGVKEKTSQVVVAELGVDMQAFPTAGHAASWAGMCPVSNESAGKRRVEHVRKCRGGLRPALTQAAWAAVRENDSYLAAQFHRLVGHIGKKKAVIAVGHSILVIAYHVLKEQKPYHDLGVDYFLRQNKEAVQRRCIRQLERLGLQVTVKPIEDAA
jgi:transposase